MALNFDKFAAQGNSSLEQLASSLGYPEDTSRAGRVLVSVLHALRNQLTLEESVQLLAQLPMFLKAVYVLNWSLHSKRKRPRHLDEFIKEIRQIHGKVAEHDFLDDIAVKQAMSCVFALLRQYISPGEMEDIESVLPRKLKSILEMDVPL